MPAEPHHDEDLESLFEHWTPERQSVAGILAAVLTVASLLVVARCTDGFPSANILMIGLTYVAGIVLHELVHGAAFIAMGASVDSIRIGVEPRMNTPYCACLTPLTRARVNVSTAAPLVVLGLVPLGVAIHQDSGLLAWFASLMIGAAAGDVIDLCSPGQVSSRVVMSRAEPTRQELQRRFTSTDSRSALQRALDERDAA